MDMSDPATFTALGAVAAAGAGAIGKLWATIVTHHEFVKKSLEECEEEHKKARARIDVLGDNVSKLSSEVGHMKGRMEGLQESENRRVHKEHSDDQHS